MSPLAIYLFGCAVSASIQIIALKLTRETATPPPFAAWFSVLAWPVFLLMIFVAAGRQLLEGVRR